MALRRERMRLGDLLIRQNVLTEEELKKALALQKGSGKKIGEVLVDNGFITEDMIVRVLQMQLGLKVVQLIRRDESPRKSGILASSRYSKKIYLYSI